MQSVRIIWGLAAALTLGAAESPAKIQARLYTMFSEATFATVNRNDAMASLRLWVAALGKRRGFDFDSKLEIFRSVEEVIPRLEAGTVDLLVLDTPDYLRLLASGLVEPVAAGTPHRYLMIGREPLGAAGAAELRGKRALVASRTKGDLGGAWLESHLAANKLGPAADFFSSLTLLYKPSGCVLPVFFGKADICVVDAPNWKLLQELNPQLSRLRVLAESGPLTEGVVAMRARRHPHHDELVESILRMHEDPAGAQMVTLFRTGQLHPVSKTQIEDVRRVLNINWRGQGRGGGAAR